MRYVSDGHSRRGSSSMNGRKDATKQYADHQPSIAGNLVHQTIDRQNNVKQAGERYRLHTDEERNDLIHNLVDALTGIQPDIQNRMTELFSQCDEGYGRRVREGRQRASGTADMDNAPKEAEGSALSAQAY